MMRVRTGPGSLRGYVAAVVFAGGLAAAAPTVLAQSGAAGNDATPAFEVVSIRVATQNVGNPPSAPDRYHKASAQLSDLLVDAFGYQRLRIVGLPEWNGSTRFEVSAKAADPLTPETTKLMLQRMLAERFSLQSHVESRDLPHYALVTVRDGQLGPQLSRTTVDCAAILAERARAGQIGLAIPRTPGAEKPVCGTFFYAISKPDGQRSLRYMTSGSPLSAIASFLSGPAQRPVVDRTGLTSDFDADIEFSVLNGAQADQQASVFTAVEEQLGLRLQSQRGPIEVLVIDAVSLPSGN